MKFKLPFLLIPIVLIGCIVSLPLNSTFPSTGSSLEERTNELYGPCTTQSCNDAVESMLKGINKTADPCDDFYQYTCGSYMETTNSNSALNDKPELNWYKWLSEKMEKQLMPSLEKDADINDTEPIRFTKYFYQTCINESAFDEQGPAPFLNIMEQVGGWPVLKGDTWNETAFNWNRVVFKIGNKNYWDNIFLPITAHRDPDDPTQFNIIVGEPTFIIPKHSLNDDINNNEVQSYFKYMVDMAVSLGASRSIATKELNETLQFEIKLVNITMTGKKNSDPNLLITISELMKNYSFIPWDENIKYQLPSNVTLEDINNKIMVKNLNYINDLKGLIESTPPRVIANYIMWRNLDVVADISNKNIYNIKKNFKNPNNANNLDDSRAKQCYDFVFSNMPLVLNIIYIREYFDKNTESNVSIILDNIQNEFVGLLKDASWMDEETRNRSIDKAESLNRIIGYPKELLNDSMTNEYLKNLKFIDNNNADNFDMLFIYVKELKTFHPITFFDGIEELILYGAFTLEPATLYLPYYNVLFAPAGSLQSPHYSYDYPMFMNYGKLGSFLAHEIAHGFDEERRKLDKYNDFLEWPDRTEEIYNNSTACILEEYSNYLNELTAKESLNDDIADNIGIKAAYYAYERLPRNDDKNVKTRDEEYTPQQMFWISYAHSWCRLPKLDSGYSLSKDRVIGPLSNMKEFSHDFNCPKNSPMNPSKKCEIL